MTEAYRHAEASTVAPFEYTSIILALIVGYTVFGDQPTLHILVGGAMVIGAGIFIVWRERQLGIERRAARTAATPRMTFRRCRPLQAGRRLAQSLGRHLIRREKRLDR